MATIQRSERGWILRVTIDGVRRRFTFASRAEAEEFRHRVETHRRDVRAGLGATPPTARPLFLADLFVRLEREQRASGRAPKTLMGTAYVAGLFRRCFGERKHAPLTETDVLEFREWLATHSETRGRLTAAALGIVATAHRVSGLPVPRIAKVRREARTRPTVALEDVRRFLEAMPVGSVERTFAELVLRTGCRESEARRLRVGDVDLAAGTVTITRAKGWQSATPLREVHPLGPAFVALLAPYVATMPPGDTGPFLRYHGAELGEQTLRARFVAAGARAGLPVPANGIGWLRNQAATLASDRGVPIEVLRRVLGHADSRTTERHYDQAVRWRARQEFAAAVDGLLSPPPAARGAARRRRK